MAEVSAKELRSQMGRILQRVRAGERITVTLRGRPVAVLTPFHEASDSFRPIAFGIWKDREDVEDVQQWLDKVRRARHLTSSSTQTS